MKKIILLVALLPLCMFSCKKNDGNPNQNNNGGAFTALYNFSSTSGQNPYGALIISGTTLYGMTSAGGQYGFGTIFSININGSGYTDLHDFAGGTTDGETPYGDLTLVGNTLYGLTHEGGANLEGVLFSMSMGGGGYKVLYNFGATSAGGVYPDGSLTAVGNILYGMTSEGGAQGTGNIFSYNLADTTYTDIYDFQNGQGVYPGGTLTVSGNTLYGMAYLGGGSANDGVVFSISTTGTGYANLVKFTGTNGANPEGSLILNNGTLYGMCSAGGANSYGNIFSVSTSGSNFKDIYDFNSSTGPAAPWGSLIISGSTLYGTTTSGADIGGNVFSISTTGSGFTNLYSFNTGANGSFPHGAVLLSNNVLYGMTEAGGKYSYGTVFSLGL